MPDADRQVKVFLCLDCMIRVLARLLNHGLGSLLSATQSRSVWLPSSKACNMCASEAFIGLKLPPRSRQHERNAPSAAGVSPPVLPRYTLDRLPPIAADGMPLHVLEGGRPDLYQICSLGMRYKYKNGSQPSSILDFLILAQQLNNKITVRVFSPEKSKIESSCNIIA